MQNQIYPSLGLLGPPCPLQPAGDVCLCLSSSARTDTLDARLRTAVGCQASAAPPETTKLGTLVR